MFGTPAPQATKPYLVPAPIGGINAQDSLMTLPGEDCVDAFNLIPQTYGMQVRKGHREYAKTVPGAAKEIRTIMPFMGSTTAQNRLFCATQNGIYDISATGVIGALVLTWGSQTGDAGDCSFLTFTNSAGKFLLVCDEVNGYHYYSETGGTWTVVGGAITGATAGNFRHVSVWKRRVWFVDSTNSRGYYLAVDAIVGAATAFYFGSKFPRGGYLKSLHSFTHDGGTGPEDYLVALSSAGDVLVYQGTDPADADNFNIVGSWNIGDIPAGRKGTSQSGGDLYILCGLGVVSLAQLLKGVDPGVTPAYVTGKVTALVRAFTATRSTNRGWFLMSIPQEGILLLAIPDAAGGTGTSTQFVMNLATRAWSVFNDLPMVCAANYNGALYLGGTDQVFTYEGYLDNVLLSDPPDNGTPIHFFVLTAFRGDEAGGAFRRVHFIRPQFLSAGQPSYATEARYDFDLESGGMTVYDNGSVTTAGGAAWAVATWGTALWGSSSYAPDAEVMGADGMGRFTAIALEGRSVYATTLLGFTIMLDSGGLL